MDRRLDPRPQSGALRVELDLERGFVSVVCSEKQRAAVFAHLLTLPGTLRVLGDPPTICMPTAGLCEAARRKLTREAGRSVKSLLIREGLL